MNLFYFLSQNLEMDSRIVTQNSAPSGCPFCGDEENIEYSKADTSWAGIVTCTSCSHVSYISFPDHMSGDHSYITHTFKPKQYE